MSAARSLPRQAFTASDYISLQDIKQIDITKIAGNTDNIALLYAPGGCVKLIGETYEY